MKIFMRGRFVGHKTHRAYSGTPVDQMHEWLIAVLKDDGGIIGLTHDMEKLQEFMVLAPEFARLIKEYEDGSPKISTKHHEQYPKFQSRFLSDVKALAVSFKDYGNMFLENYGFFCSFTHLPSHEQ